MTRTPLESEISNLTRDLFAREEEIAQAALNALGRLLGMLLPEELPAAEELIRTIWRGMWTNLPWVQPMLKSGSVPLGVFGLLSFHPSGYVREPAVRRLAERTDGAELPFLLLRLADWVEPVRVSAERAVRQRMQPESAAAFARNFSLVERVGRSGRVDRESLLGPLQEVFVTAEGQSAIVDAMRSGPPAARRAVVRFVLERLPGAADAIVALGARGDDERIRRWVTPSVTDLSELQRLAADRSPAVRTAALHGLARSFPAEAEPLLDAGLLDRSASVRELSRFLTRERHPVFASLYRTAMDTAATARQLVTAIAGLAETGLAKDAESVAPHLTNPGASVRRAAVKAVMRLAGDAFADRIAAFLADPSPGVSAAARDALRKHAPGIGRQHLEEIFANAIWLHTRLNVVRLFAALPKWQSIIGLVRAAAASEPEAAEAARAAIETWNRNYNKGNAVPTARELDELEAALAAAERTLGADVVGEIRFTMKAFRAR